MNRAPAAATSFAVVATMLAPVAGLDAQNATQAGLDRPAVDLEVSKAFFENDGVGLPTSVLDATVIFPLANGPALLARWGISYATLDGVESSTTMSNLRLGAVFGDADGATGEVHVDLPTARESGLDDFATGFAILTDYERLERFVPEAWSIGGSYATRRTLSSGAVVGGRAGATVLVPTADGADAELLLIPGVFGKLPSGNAWIGGELSGSVIASEGGLSLGQRSVVQATLSVELPTVSTAPHIYLRVPLDDDLSGAIDAVLGVRLRLGG